MSEVVVVLSDLYPNAAWATREPGRRRVTMIGDSGTVLSLPLAPTDMDHSGMARAYDQLERVGLKPILSKGSPGLRVYAFTLILASRHPGHGGFDTSRPVVNELVTLQKFAESGERLQWTNFGRVERGFFRMTNLAFRYAQRKPGSNEVTVAEATIELTEASDVKIRIGPVSGGAVSTPPKPPTQAGSGAPVQQAGKTYTVVSGDTLWKIAQREYGNGAKYTVIADANGITNPNLIHVGQVLTIPPG